MLGKDADEGEISLAENYARASMNIADQLTAFRTLIEQGRTTADIGERFGISAERVMQILRLANVAPEILEAVRNREISMEVFRAFGATADQDRQLAVWRRVDLRYPPQPHCDP